MGLDIDAVEGKVIGLLLDQSAMLSDWVLLDCTHKRSCRHKSQTALGDMVNTVTDGQIKLILHQ
jgi:hypothetical protein